MFNSEFYKILLALLWPIICAETTEYCDKELCGEGIEHIACNNDGAFQAACGTEPQIIEITQEYQDLIVDKHNRIRDLIAGGFQNYETAERMATMTWHTELAQLAELNVRKCVMEHDNCHNTKEFRYAGQNLAISSFRGREESIADIIDLQIQQWFNEFQNCSMEYINEYKEPNWTMIGHFTTMVQDKSNYIGCSIIRFIKSNGFTAQLMACNYALANMIGESVYATGQPATKCWSGANPDYEYLCSIDEEYEY